MQSLRCIALAMKPLGPRALFYLAAAVSDFYIPWTELVSMSVRGVALASSVHSDWIDVNTIVCKSLKLS